MKLTKVERWMLSNQFRILEALYPQEASDLAEAREAIERGYEMHYGEFSQHIYDDTFSEDESKEVLDILSMFSEMKFACEKMTDKAGIEEHRVKFTGFDGNNEPRQMAYAQYFCTTGNGRFTNLDCKNDFNSHAPLLRLYQKMLVEWKKSKQPMELTKEDVVRITSVKM